MSSGTKKTGGLKQADRWIILKKGIFLSATRRRIDRALNEMPKEFTIKEYLIGNRSEVKMDFMTEYNEAEVMAYLKEEAREMGMDEIVTMYCRLKSEGRDGDADRFMTDAAYRKQLLAERAVAVV